MTKAVALLSGGLDSRLAIKVIQEQGIEVEALHFITLFCQCTSGDSCKTEAMAAAEQLGVPLKTINASKSMLEIIKNPKHGYGKNMNPCIDCRINMLREAIKYMHESGADFVVTGEVLGQRPMSQRRDAMRIIDREAGAEGNVLRPLSAKLLEPTEPEKKGLVDREKLPAISGRSRKPQMQLAEVFEMRDYPCPAGGCLLTQSGFARKIRDLVEHGDPDLNDVHLLKTGRHFRLDEKTWVVIGKDHADNQKIATFARKGDTIIETVDVPGPTTLVRGGASDEKVEIAARLTARYSQGRRNETVTVALYDHGEKEPKRTVPVKPAAMEEYREMLIG
ncbi:MAG: hypothetical protein ABIH04_05350 [Planctomycetota bacterium]